MRTNTLIAASITASVAISLLTLNASAASNNDKYFINDFGSQVNFTVAANKSPVRVELAKAIAKAIKLEGCKVVSAAINPGSASKAIISVAIRDVHRGARPNITRHSSTGFSARWENEGVLYRVCISNGGKGHAAMGLYEKPFKYTANFDLSAPVKTTLYFN